MIWILAKDLDLPKFLPYGPQKLKIKHPKISIFFSQRCWTKVARWHEKVLKRHLSKNVLLLLWPNISPFSREGEGDFFSPWPSWFRRPCLHVLGAAGLFKLEPFANPSVEVASLLPLLHSIFHAWFLPIFSPLHFPYRFSSPSSCSLLWGS